MHDYDITCETDGDMALLVAPFAGLETNDVIATRRVAQDGGDLLVFHAGLDLGVVLRSHLAAGGEKANENYRSGSIQYGRSVDHFIDQRRPARLTGPPRFPGLVLPAAPG